MSRRPCAVLVAALAAALLAGCATRPGTGTQRQAGESVVFIGEEPAALAHPPERKQPVVVRNTYLSGPGTVAYTEGRDYTIDRKRGTLSRTANSGIPDFRKNILFGRDNFDHTQTPGFGNGGYFAFVDYA